MAMSEEGTGRGQGRFGGMRIHAILNIRAGTMLSRDPEQVARAIEKRLVANSNDVRVDLVEPADLDAAMDRALAGDIDALVVGGGDGSILAAAKKLAGKSVLLGIIPLGTLNRLARDLNIPFEPEEAAGVIGEGNAVAIDVADVNGHVFLCNSLLGLPIRVTEQRQALRGASWGERIKGYFSIFQNFLANRRRFAIEIDDGHVARRVRALSIAISNNPLTEGPTMALTRPSISGGKLALYLSKHKTGGAMGWAVLRRMFGRHARDPEVEEFCADGIVLRSHRPKVKVSNDGEIEELETPLRYSIDPGALHVLAPRAA